MKNTTRNLLVGALVALLPNIAAAGTETKNWDWSTGDAKTISAYLNGRLDIQGEKNLLKLTATGTAGAKVFGKAVDILKLTASAGIGGDPFKKSGTNYAANTGQVALNASFNVQVAGSTVYTLSQSQKLPSWAVVKSASKSLDASTTIPFNILGVPMSVKLGVTGSAGINFAFSLSPIAATLNVKPYVKSSAYAQVGVDLYVLKAGVQGTLTILNDDLDITAEAYFTVANKALNLYTSFKGTNTINMLNGSIGVYGEINYLFGSKKASIDIFKWSGITAKSTLWNVNKTIKLISL